MPTTSPPPAPWHAGRLVSVALATAVVVTGCSVPWGDDTDGARAAARRLATALVDGDVADVPRVRGRSVDLDEVLGALSDAPRRVRAEDVEVDDDRATVALRWRWSVGGRTWSYRSRAVFRQDADDRWRWQAGSDTVHPRLGSGGRLSLAREPAARGRILGAGDAPLVVERPVVRVGVDKTLVDPAQARAAAPRLAGLLDLDAARFEKRVGAAGARAFVEAVLLRTEDLPPALQARVLAVPGARILRTTRPLAPSRAFADSLLGTVGPATAEVVEESDGRVAAGDLTGLSGLQRRYDPQLAGRAGVVVTATDRGRETEVLREPAEAGRDVRLTLDPREQAAAERAVADVGPAAAVVVLDSATGSVLAAADGPGAGGADVATTGRYAPGSTFKIVSALALLRRGVGADDPVPCTAGVTVDGRRFENYDDYPAGSVGTIPFAEAFAQSCNTAFIAERGRLSSPDDLTGAAASLGLGTDRQVGYPSYFGQVPRADGETDAAAAMIGQGRVLASPLAMATVAASVASGRTTVPTLVAGAAAPEVPDTLEDDEAATLRRFMRGVVDGGSGSSLPRGLDGAKTGTAEFGTETPPQRHAWLVVQDGPRSVAVFVEEGESGSATAGPVLERYLRSR